MSVQFSETFMKLLLLLSENFLILDLTVTIHVLERPVRYGTLYPSKLAKNLLKINKFIFI